MAPVASELDSAQWRGVMPYFAVPGELFAPQMTLHLLRDASALITDEELMREFQRGSRDAFEVLFSRYRVLLYGFFFRRLRNPGRADDLTQETFVALIRAIARWKPQASVRTYLFGIALRVIAADRRKERSEDDKEIAVMTEPAAEPEVVLAVRHALNRLEPNEREVLMLREYEQLSYQEIADVLGVPVNTVRSRLFRARMALKEILEPAKREACSS